MDEEPTKIKDTEETSVLGEEGEKKAIVAEEELSSGKVNTFIFNNEKVKLENMTK